ncbi:unnamed protein product (macronuclear) [Paramecium tetraurelia]|uniref:EF-hand domain-containing protein n=1 Tax=Paramecium tetraurelia TaxID=5888 RepID=A0EDU7_PARTE|nr:uncharacterized protein GSPATT00025808001 [Paramecium tetraurelia]CAK93464.1 unnamed protein product [Paramecium tetraurelia]|eukprot:XP_001460861.1 hypothetical protein (macronuclear) [Paramecium tetraurelia strain d4-2]
MQSPFRLYSAQRTFTCRNVENKASFFISKKTKQTKKQQEIDNLNEQLLKVKQSNNQLFEENKQLKQQILHFEKQLNKQEKLLILNTQAKAESKQSELEFQVRMKTEETCSIIAYQKQIKDYKARELYNQQQIEELKRDTRRTKLQECQIECKIIKEELEKMKFKYQALIHQIQFSQKDELLKDNIKISQELLISQQKIQELELHNKKIQQDLHHSDFKRMQSEKLVFDKEKELQLIQFEYSNPKKTINDLNRQWQMRLENQKQLYQQLEEEVKLRNDKINLLEKTLKEDKTAYQLKEAHYKREIDNLNIQIGQFKETIQHLENQQIAEKSSDEQESLSEKSVRKASQNYQKQKTVVLNRKKVQKVSLKEVEIIGKELALKLQLAQIPFSKLDSFLYSKSSRGIINLSEIDEILKQSPFDLPDDQALLVARFLAEPEQEEWIYYDSYQTNDVVIVISIFRNLIKPFELLNPQYYDTIHQELKQIFKHNKNKLTDYLMLNGDNCDLTQFKKAFEYCDIPLTQEQETYISIRMYEKYRRIENLKYQEIIDYFK